MSFLKDRVAQAILAEQETVEARARETEVTNALDAAQLALDEFYNGDRVWAEAWLLKAFEANKEAK